MGKGIGRRGEERGGEAAEMDGWTDKTETAAARQRTHIPCKEGMWRGTGLFQRRWKASGQRERGEEWRWRTLAVRTGAGMELDLISQVSSHYLCLLLSPLCPITATMKQAPFLQSCIWLSGCKAITPEWSYAVFDRYSMCETQRATVGCCLTERELLLWQLVPTRFLVNADMPTSLSRAISSCVRLNHLLSASTSASEMIIQFSPVPTGSF